MRKPDFFVVGAPRCGTTALCRYLAEHPGVRFSRPKEPFYFSSDLGIRTQRYASDDEYVRRCFGDTAGALAVGEGSTTYLFSEAAVPRILAFNPAARLIVMARNPLEMAPSVHAWRLLFGNEDVADFAAAWDLQEARRSGRGIPPRCNEPRALQYLELCSLGAQVERLLRVAPLRQVHVALHDDLVAAPRALWGGVQRFLGLPDDGRQEFPRVNEGRAATAGAAGRLLLRPPPWLAGPWRALKRRLGVEETGLMRLALRLGAHRAVRPQLALALRLRLAAAFRDDVVRLGALLGRDLSHWLAPAGPR